MITWSICFWCLPETHSLLGGGEGGGLFFFGWSASSSYTT